MQPRQQRTRNIIGTIQESVPAGAQLEVEGAQRRGPALAAAHDLATAVNLGHLNKRASRHVSAT
jgi:hypothetical protein